MEAARTVTLGLPKAGFLTGRVPQLAREVWVVDIGVPEGAHALAGIRVSGRSFALGDSVTLSSLA